MHGSSGEKLEVRQLRQYFHLANRGAASASDRSVSNQKYDISESVHESHNFVDPGDLLNLLFRLSPTVCLREGRERSLLRRHPWVFEGGLAKSYDLPSGETVRMEAADGRFLGWGAYSPRSSIRVRVWSFEEGEEVGLTLFRRRIREAVGFRSRLGIQSDAFRLIHGESDGLPGLIVDRYGDVLSTQFGSAGAERHKKALTDALIAETSLKLIYERSDAAVRKLEGLEEVTGWLAGASEEEMKKRECLRTIREHDMKLLVDVAHGHKTGYYLDQRENRRLFRDWLKRLNCKRVLNCFAYTGGFTVAALQGDAEHVVSVDTSAPSLSYVEQNVQLNRLDTKKARTRNYCGILIPHALAIEAVCQDANTYMREQLDAGTKFDAIVLDPPKFAPTAAHAERAARAYKDINRLALKLLAPGGLLFTFSCSGGIDPTLFHKIVAGAAMDAQVNARIVARLESSPDHPTTMFFPEGEYLKGLAMIKAA